MAQEESETVNQDMLLSWQASQERFMAKSLCSKGCGFCKSWRTSHTVDVDPPEHQCFINHEGSSKPLAVLEMCMWLHNHQVTLGCIVADDDSLIQAKLKWSNEDHMLNHNVTVYPTIINSVGNEASRPNDGGTPRHVPEPSFVADPNHRRKTMVNCLCAFLVLPETDPVSDHLKKKPPKRKNKTDWRMTFAKMDVR